jgi:hypothetical protein
MALDVMDLLVHARAVPNWRGPTPQIADEHVVDLAAGLQQNCKWYPLTVSRLPS